MTTTSLPKRRTPLQRLELVKAIAQTFEDELLYFRHADKGRRESDAPLTDLNFDGLLLIRLAAAFDGYDFDFNADNEPQHCHFRVHLLAAAMSTLVGDEDDLDRAVEGSKELIRERRDAENEELDEDGSRSASGRLNTRMISHEKFHDL